MSLILGILDSGGAAAGGGTSYESIATVTVGSGGAADILFSSISSDYTHLQFRGNVKFSAGAFCAIQLNSVTTGNLYDNHYLNGNGSAASAGAYITRNNAILAGSGGISSSANTFTGFVLDILDYRNTNKNKTLRSLSGYDSNGSGFVEFESNLFRSTDAITSVKFVATDSQTFSQYSQIALYGIKGS